MIGNSGEASRNAYGTNLIPIGMFLGRRWAQRAGKELTMSHTEMEPEIRKIQEQLQKMASQNYGKQLLEVVHRTGWTDTQAHLVRVTLDSVTHQLEGIDRAERALIQAADEIGKAKGRGA